ncbi:MAG: TadE/TadG family type IV pilus assembly protein [Pseudomonadota bacterium]
MNLFSRFLRRRPRDLARDEKGISAVEFALIAPVLVVFYFGCVEISTMLIVDRKVTNVASSVADLVTRQPTIDATEMTNVFNSGVITMAPHDFTPVRIRVSSIIFDVDGVTPIVDWSEATSNWTALTAGDPVTVPTGMIPTDGSVILSEVEYDYTSITGLFDAESGLVFDASRTLGDQYWQRPRRTEIIDFTT